MAANGTPKLIPEVTEVHLASTVNDGEYLAMLRLVGIGAVMSALLTARSGRVSGEMTFATAESGRTLEESDTSLATEVAVWAGFAIDNALLYRNASEACERLKALFMQAPAIVAVSRGPDRVFELVNPRLVELLGDRGFIGRPAREVIPEAHVRGMFDVAHEVFLSGEPLAFMAVLGEYTDQNGRVQQICNSRNRFATVT